MNVFDWLNYPRSTLLPAAEAFPAEPYPDHLVAGSGMPVTPSQALVMFSAPDLQHLPPWRAVSNRPAPTLTRA